MPFCGEALGRSARSEELSDLTRREMWYDNEKPGKVALGQSVVSLEIQATELESNLEDN